MKWVRQGITIILTAAVIYGFIIKTIPSEAFFGFATGLIVWEFKERDEDKRRNIKPPNL